MAYLRLVAMPFLLQIQFSSISFFWLLACIALGIGYALLLYFKSTSLPSTYRKLLFILRAIIVSGLSFLLFAPLLKSSNYILEKPLIFLAQDNSASIKISKPKNFNLNNYSSNFKNLEKSLSKDYQVLPYNFNSIVKKGLEFKWDGRLSDISSLFKMINSEYSDRNIGAIIVATDGIYNKGGNPKYEIENIKAPIYTIALGDTIPKRDLLLSNVNFNNLAYLGNQFQLEVSLEAFQSKGSNSQLTISDNSGTVYSKQVAINSNEFRQSIHLTLLAKRKGIQKFVAKLSTITNELSVINNVQTFFVEIIDGRQNVLIIANAPHPDLTALKQSIEINKNYEVKIAFKEALSDSDIEKAGLIVMYQLPSITYNAQNILTKIADKPILYILGAQTNAATFSAAQPLINISAIGNTTQEAIAQISTEFYSFTLNESTKSKIQNFVPLLTPFGSYAIKGSTSVLINQQIAKVNTPMPLLIFGEGIKHKIGVLAGEGIWRWRLEEFQESSTHEAVNELVNKTVQYLSSRDDKRKFRVYSSKNSFEENDHIILNAELYNDAYELVNTPDVKISLKSKSGKEYNYLFSKVGNSYVLDAGILPSGEFSYQSSTQLGNKKYSASGSFVISQQQAEFQQTTANHQLLYSISKQSGGKMIYPDELGQLPKLIKENENVKTLSFENRRYDELINFKMIFFLILALLSLEWFLRKRNGEV